MPPEPAAAKLGILAGSGTLPGRIIEHCVRAGRAYFVIAFKDQTDPQTVAGSPHLWVRLGAAGQAVAALKKAGVRDLVMAGGINRPSMRQLMPDAWGLKFLGRSGLSRGDDDLLSRLVRALEQQEGFRVVGIDDLLPGLLATPGAIGRHAPNAAMLADIEAGLRAARALGARDQGQAVVIRAGSLLAEEAADGTDAMLGRLRPGHPHGRGGVLVKAPKPGQERRADLPAIGPGTVAAAKAAGLDGIAVEAGGALLIEAERSIAEADAAGLFLFGAPPPAPEGGR